jgi:hypothetical protein
MNSKVEAMALADTVERKPAAVKKASFYRPELDCLRFFAFFAVFIHHSLPSTADFYRTYNLPAVLANVPYAGAWGVDLFFCLSAYLITELLLREKDVIGYLNVRAFYVRRMLRIWPLYFAFVLFAFGITFVDHSQEFSATNLAMFLMLAGNWAAAILSKGRVSIGEGTRIGENASILSCNIGRNCVIGSNAVVVSDIPDCSVAVGAPARIVRRFDWMPCVRERTGAGL